MAATTYTLRAFVSEDREKVQTTPGLSLEVALDRKTALLERVPACVSASVTPERKSNALDAT